MSQPCKFLRFHYVADIMRIEYVLRGGEMRKRLTITLDEQVYEGLHRVIGRRRISQFIESLVRPHVMDSDLEMAYAQMAQDEAREAEATIANVADETR